MAALDKTKELHAFEWDAGHWVGTGPELQETYRFHAGPDVTVSRIRTAIAAARPRADCPETAIDFFDGDGNAMAEETVPSAEFFVNIKVEPAKGYIATVQYEFEFGCTFRVGMVGRVLEVANDIAAIAFEDDGVKDVCREDFENIRFSAPGFEPPERVSASARPELVCIAGANMMSQDDAQLPVAFATSGIKYEFQKATNLTYLTTLGFGFSESQEALRLAYDDVVRALVLLREGREEAPLAEGVRVCVVEEFWSYDDGKVELKVGMSGTVLEIDGDGDAVVDFDGVENLVWVFSEDFAHMMIEELEDEHDDAQAVP